MQKILNSVSGPWVAVLYSDDRKCSFEVHLENYEFPNITSGPDSNWYRVLFEYRSPQSSYKFKTTCMDAKSFESAVYSLKLFRAFVDRSHCIISPPYREDVEINLVVKKARIRRRFRDGIFPKFEPRMSGLFVQGKVGQVSFHFKSNRVELKKFGDKILTMTQAFPVRYRHKSIPLNPVKGLEGSFCGNPLSEGVKNWYVSWIETSIAIKLKPVLRVIHRQKRRHRLTQTKLNELVGYAKTKCREEEVESWR